MASGEHSFIDIAVRDDVRERFAAGDALLVLDTRLSEVIWANGPGAALFDHDDIEAIIGAEPPLGTVAKRQIMALPNYPAIGRDRSLMVRMAAGVSSRAMPFLASGMTLPGGEKAILLSVPADTSRGESETAARVISGLSQPGQFVALVGKDGRLVATSAGFETLGITADTLAGLASTAAGRDRLVKKMIPAGARLLPAGLARLTETAHLFVVVDEEGAQAAEAHAADVAVPTPEIPEPAAAPEENAPAVDALDVAQPAPETPPAATSPVQPEAIAADEASAELPSLSVPEPSPEVATGAPAAATEAELPADIAPSVERASAPVRFIWRTDAAGKFSALSPEFASAVGTEAANVIGFDFRDVCKVFGMDPGGEIAGLLERRDTWSGRSLLWPVAGTDLRVPVDLAALPVYDRDRNFEGFRGFGVVRAGDAMVDPDAVGLTLVEPAARTPGTEEAAPPTARVETPPEPERPDPFQGEMPALSIVPKPDRRFTDKVIRLAEHRTPANDRGLTPVERNAFREIGDRLKKESGEPAEAAKSAVAPEAASPPGGEREAGAPSIETAGPAAAAEGAPTGSAASEPPAATDATPPAEMERSAETEPAVVAEGAPAVEITEIAGEAAPATEIVEADLPPLPPESSDAETRLPEAAEPVAPKTARPWILGRMQEAPPPDDATETTGDRGPVVAGGEAVDAEAGARAIEIAGELPAASDAHPDRGAVDPTTADAQDTVSPAVSTGLDSLLSPEAPVESAPRAPLFESLAAESMPEAGSEPTAAVADAAPQAAIESFTEPTEAVATSDPVEPPGSSGPRVDEPVPDLAASAEDEAPRRPPVDTSILDRLPIPVLIHSGDVLYYANREFLEFTAYSSVNELAERGGLGELFAEPYPPEGEDGTRKLRLRRGDELELPVEAFLQSVPWNGGKALLLSLRRISRAPLPMPVQPPAAPLKSEEKLALEALITELGTIIDTATDGVILISEAGIIRSISRPAEALFGFDSADVAGKPFATLFAVESQRTAKDYLNSLSDNGVKSVLNDGREVIGREAQGRFIPLFMTIGRLPNRNGYCAVLRDITQWKRAEEELTHARSQAERASSQKTEFLARVSHEIRTPLNAIIGFSELMMDEKFGPIGNDRYRDYLRDINRSGNHVLDLVNDLLDISKIEAGQQEMSYEAVSLNDTLSESVALMQPQANRERVIIRSSFASGLPEVVADLRTIRQIALNLLSNAIRYTQAGGQVIVSTAYETNGEVVLRFRDTGIGMSNAEIEQALKPFKQINAIKRPRGDGTGLGLPLTKAMVEANRARFSINSTPGEGTLVEITFPSTRVLAA